MAGKKPISPCRASVYRLLNVAFWTYIGFSDFTNPFDTLWEWPIQLFYVNRYMDDPGAMYLELSAMLPLALMADWDIRRDARKSREQTTTG